MAELPEQYTLGPGIARVEFPQLGVERVIEEKRSVLNAVGGRDFRIKPAPLLGFLAGHKCPAGGLGVAEDAGLDCQTALVISQFLAEISVWMVRH